MAFGVYVHIPFCLQKCSYCDFATVEDRPQNEMEDYLKILLKEVQLRHSLFAKGELHSIYFGGGTPSLVPPAHLLQVIEEIKSHGFCLTNKTEVTIEINPATISEEKMCAYLEIGVNRFSVGVQSFNDSLLQKCGRKHSAADARQTLDLLKEFQVNYSFDLLYALPDQSIESLQADLNVVNSYKPPHVSAYCLTVPPQHEMARGRPEETVQVEMQELITKELHQYGCEKYEISNFAVPGFESKHNQLYWEDKAYWGLGVSAHSYLPGNYLTTQTDRRFWNSRTLNAYKKAVDEQSGQEWTLWPEKAKEELTEDESLTDFCYTHLRVTKGLSVAKLRGKYIESLVNSVVDRLESLAQRELVACHSEIYALTRKGELISNEVFRQLTFSSQD